LQVEGQHTGENIAASIQRTVDEWSIGLPNAVTTDNAANEQKAIRLLGYTRFGCYGHRINLVVKKAIQCDEIKDLLKKGRTLVSFFHKSSSATDMLAEQQRLNTGQTEKQDHRLIMDCKTRWNSTLNMLDRLVEQTPYIVNIANLTTISKSTSQTIKLNAYSFAEMSILQDVIKLLKPFEIATTVLCSQISPTMQHVMPVTKKLLSATEEHEDDAEVVKIMKRKMATELRKRAETEELPLLAALLNPDTKLLPFATDEEKQRARQLLREKASVTKVKKDEQLETAGPTLPQLPEIPNDDDDDEVQVKEPENPAKKARIQCSDAIEWLGDVCITSVSEMPKETLLDAEIDRYFSFTRKESDASLTLLQWWKENEQIFPNLAAVAKGVLSVPASSVPAERVFSLAGTIVSKKRNRLSPENVNKFIFLNMNMKLYW